MPVWLEAVLWALGGAVIGGAIAELGWLLGRKLLMRDIADLPGGPEVLKAYREKHKRSRLVKDEVADALEHPGE